MPISIANVTFRKRIQAMPKNGNKKPGAGCARFQALNQEARELNTELGRTLIMRLEFPKMTNIKFIAMSELSRPQE